MLDYEWGNVNPSTIMFTGDETAPEVEQNRQFYDAYSAHALNEANAALFHHSAAQYHHHHQQQQQNNHHLAFHQLDNSANSGQLSSIYEQRAAAYGGASSYAHHHHQQHQLLSLAPTGSAGYVVVPKSEPMVDFNAAGRIGLNLGGRTYFSSSEDDFVSRLYRRSRLAEPGAVHSPRCQAEGCNADLSNAKHYHRRHKVCEFHSKAATVIASGLTQRFCQQCSRFHLLSEFDNGKRSCRKRLADHNRRRRKSQQQQQQQQPNQENGSIKPPQNSKDSSRSPPESSSGAHSSSVTVAISSPRISLDCFMDRPSSSSYQGSAPATTNSSASTSSLFFSDGL